MFEKISASVKNLTATRGLVLAAMLLAVYAVLGIFKIPIPPSSLENRLTLTFTATSAAGIILGPVPALLVGALGDILGYFFNHGGGAYFPGFSISAALGGFIYGICLYRREPKTAFWWTLLSVLLVTFFVNILLNTFWLMIMYQKAYSIFAAARIIKNLALLPFHTAIIFTLYMTFYKTGIIKKYI